MGKTVSVIALALLALSCTTARTVGNPDEDPYTVINGTLKDVEYSKEMFFKSFKDKLYDAEYVKHELIYVVINHVNDENAKRIYHIVDSIRSLTHLSQDEKESIIDSIAIKEKDNLTPKVSDFLTPADLDHMGSSFVKGHKWKKAKINNKIPLSRNPDAKKVSVPVFNLKGDVAFYFIQYSSGLQAFFCKKDGKGQWSYYCSATVWIE